MKHILLVVIFLTLALSGCSNINSAIPANPSQKPLDPQGNWLFILTDSNQSTWSFGGELFELTSPTVTSNGFLAVNDPLNCRVSPSMSGQASGTNSITLNVSGTVFSSKPTPAYTLTGTIADDQQHMSGSFTSTQTDGCITTTSGTWTAMQIPAINGTWSGTASSGTLTLSLTENTDQTSPNMGAVTGTITVSAGETCAAAGTYTLNPNVSTNVHVGEVVDLGIADSNGVLLGLHMTVDPATNNSGVGGLTYTGGACDHQSANVTFSKQ